ncbi:MAG: 4Fe-4S binding protein [Spirochaetaceae bacterium]|nr:4Fe-4S binding protein [Spirochaetaceae bacterium]
MTAALLAQAIASYVNRAGGNVITQEQALSPDLAGLRLFDRPLIGFAGAGDSYFQELKKPGVVGPHLLLPGEWLPQAKTVISIFFPLTEAVRSANRRDMKRPSEAWLHGRIEGQSLILDTCKYIEEILQSEGYEALTPALDSRFLGWNPKVSDKILDKSNQAYYSSNWSERHAAYASGLGTFGLSRGIITRAGMAGRFGSVITQAYFEPSVRPYTGVYDYCIHCGACAVNCPVKAISLEEGKRHPPCSEFLDGTKLKNTPHYGCGKCQVKVPCESGIP